MNLQEKFSLTNRNTFGVPVVAQKFVEVLNVDNLKTVLQKFTNESKLFLSGGSNILFTKDFDGIVIAPNILGKNIVSESDDLVIVQSGAGENWDEFVAWTVTQNFGGLENLSLIPGNVGTCPIQNIGAYGTEIKDTFKSLLAINIATGEEKMFEKNDCKFGYRDSVFKNEEKNKWVIVSVDFELSKNPTVNIKYGAIQKIMTEAGIKNPTIKDVRETVIKIRTQKLPDPKIIGNAGSFFKNPIVTQEQFKKIQTQYSDMPFYEVPNGMIKIPAGWLIDTLGWKGKKMGTVGVHPNQALVLINLGGATGKEVLALAQKIQTSVLENFDITLEIEVNIL